MHLTSAILFSLCSNIDNLPIGLAYGLRNIRISFGYNLFISFFISAGTWLCLCLSDGFLYLFPQPALSQLACGILIILGLAIVYEALVHRDNPEIMNVKPINFQQASLLSCTLLFNNTIVGISARIAGAPILLTVVCTFLASSFFLWLGGWISRHCIGLYSSRILKLCSGMIMILLGMLELLI